VARQLGLLQIVYSRTRPSGQPPEDGITNTVHFGLPGDGWGGSEMSDVWSAITSNYTTGYRSYISPGVELIEGRFYSYDVLAPSPMTLDGVSTASIVGSGTADDELPPQDAITVTWRTSSRRHWGRIYLGGFVSAANDDGRVATALVDAIAGTWNDIVTAWQALDVEPIVFNRSTLNGLSITAVECDDVWDIQRRRRYAQSTHRVINTP
jgi:hypothetical protein